MREALRDGKIDQDEHKFLDELRRHFGMSKKQAEKLIRDVERAARSGGAFAVIETL